MTLDELIEEKKRQVEVTYSLEYARDIDGGQLDQKQLIYDFIVQEAGKLNTVGEYHYKISIKTRMKRAISKLKRFVRAIDGRLQQYSFYKNYIRKALKKIFLRQSKKETISLRKFMKGSDEEFVSNMYLQLLGREPDPMGYEHNMKLLKEKKQTRIEMVYGFYYGCNEMKKKKIRGEKFLKLIYRMEHR